MKSVFNKITQHKMNKTMNSCVVNNAVFPVIHNIVTKLDDTMDIRKMVDRVLYEMQDEISQ